MLVVAVVVKPTCDEKLVCQRIVRVLFVAWPCAVVLLKAQYHVLTCVYCAEGGIFVCKKIQVNHLVDQQICGLPFFW